MSRITNDIENVSQTLNSSIIQLFSSTLTLVGAVIVMVSLSPLLTVLTLTIVPMMFFGMKWITNRTRMLFKEQQRNLGELNGFIEESISGQKSSKCFHKKDRRFLNFNEKTKSSNNPVLGADVFRFYSKVDERIKQYQLCHHCRDRRSARVKRPHFDWRHRYFRGIFTTVYPAS